MRLFSTGPAAALLLVAGSPRAPQPLAIFGPTKTSLPPQVITIYDSFYSPTQRELARGATPKPALSDVALLWKEMVKAYGSEELALRAAAQNKQLINPKYTAPPRLIPDSKAALVKAMGSEEEAIEIMLKNPAVLQCGSYMATTPASEIRNFANVRGVLDSVPRAVSLASLGLILVAVVANIALKDTDASSVQQLLALARPLVGGIGAVVFIATLGGSVLASRDLRKAEEEVRSRNRS